MLLLCSSDVCERSVHNHCGEIFLEEGFGTLELLLRVLFHVVEFVFPSHGFPLVYAEAVVGEYLYALYLLVLAKGFTQSSDILFHITISRYEYVAEPEGMVVLFEPCGGTQGLLVATAGELAMALGVELLDVEQYEVYFVEEFFYMLVPHTTVRVNAGVYAMALEIFYYRYKGLGLYGRFAT